MKSGGPGKACATLCITDAPSSLAVASLLRAERLGYGARDGCGNLVGREYTFIVTAEDESGNVSDAVSVSVHVPHDWSAHVATCAETGCGSR